MDKRIDYKIVIDTETCPLDKECNDVIPSNMFAYDFGWVVTDKKGRVYETRSYLAKEIFVNEKDLMKSAYYAQKIPKYWEEIKNGTRTLASLYDIHQVFLADVKKYNVTKCFAHNMRFDYGVANNTMRWVTKSKFRYWFPYGMEICDTLKMARDVFGNMPTYRNFCEKNGFVTKNGKPRFTAEILNRFLTNDVDFEESHTGLEDVMIEKNIMAYCYKSHKKMRRLLWEKVA